MNRRSFFKGAMTLAAATVLPLPAFPETPVLWGDGIHDDAEGLRALFAGRDVILVKDGVTVSSAGEIRIYGLQFLVGSPVLAYTKGWPKREINNCHFTWPDDGVDRIGLFQPAIYGNEDLIIGAYAEEGK